MRHPRLALFCVLAAVSVIVSGCGFSPLYSTAGYDRLAGMSVEAGPDRFDYLLQDAVRDFAGPGASAYTLTLSHEFRVRPLGISPTGEATRVSLRAVVRYELAGPGEPISGVRTSDVTFDQPGDPYALLASRGEAEERLARRMAEEIVQALAVELRRREAGLARP